MRHDDLSTTSSLPETAEPFRAHTRSWAWIAVLTVLVVSTSFAVASVSAWLVPPYLVLMVWILSPTRAVRDSATTGSASRSDLEQFSESAERFDAGTVEVVDRPLIEAEPTFAQTGQAEDGQERALESTLVKTKRGRGRGRKGKTVTVVEPEGPTWIRVGPGKFVRGDGPVPQMTEATVPDASESELSDPPATPIASDAAETLEFPPEEPLPAFVGHEPTPAEDRFAEFGEPSEWSEPAPDEPFAEASAISSVEEACPPSPWEVVEASDDDGTSFDEPQTDDEAYAEDYGGEEPQDLDEIEPTLEDDEAEPEIAAETNFADAGWEDDEDAEFDDAAGDNGIAPDALAAETNDALLEPSTDAFAEDRQPSVGSPDVLTGPSHGASFVSWRETCSRTEFATQPTFGAGSSRLGLRGSRNVSDVPGFRRRSPRGAGRARFIRRTFPPRSPPSSGIAGSAYQRGRRS